MISAINSVLSIKIAANELKKFNEFKKKISFIVGTESLNNVIVPKNALELTESQTHATLAFSF